MKKTNKKVALMIKKLAETMADFNYGSASAWGMHQPKEPKKHSSTNK